MATSAANASRDGTIFGSSDAQLRYEAYSRLQAAAVAFGESLPIPEIVAIGGNLLWWSPVVQRPGIS